MASHLRTAVLAFCAACLPAAAPPRAAGADPASSLEPLPASEWTPEAAAHLLRRAGFGGPPSEVAALHARGPDGAVDFLVDYESVDWPDMPAPRITMRESPDRRSFLGLSEDDRQAVQREFQRADIEQCERIREWWLRLMVATPRPLEERMTLFWHGHFTSAFRTVRNSYHMYLQNALFRGHAVGDFGRLLKDVTRDPAMLRYLDGGRNRRGMPNENYAREVMELFTLGVGGYTEKDVQEAARALTGWTVAGNRGVLVSRAHDDGPKTVLGRTGALGAEELTDVLLEQPGTARRLARRLFAWFAHDDPSPEVVEGLAARLREGGFEMKPVLKTLLRSRAFHAPESRASKVKSPVDLVVGLLRTLEIDPPASVRLSRWTQALGQEVLDPPSVKGWDGGTAWISTSTLLLRYNLASAVVGTDRDRQALGRAGLGLASGRPRVEAAMERAAAREGRRAPAGYDPLAAVRAAGLSGAEPIVDHYARTLLAVEPPADLRARLVSTLAGSDGFSLDAADARERLHAMLVLLVSTPEFQVL